METKSLPDASYAYIQALRRDYVSPEDAERLAKRFSAPEDRRFIRPASKYTAVQMQLKDETNWLVEEELPDIPVSIADAVGLGQQACPLCGHNLQESGVLREAEQIVRGETTGLRARQSVLCRCIDVGRFARRWHDMIQATYQGFKLQTLAPKADLRLPVATQQILINTLKATADWSYLIVGPAATSKTVYSTCLFRKALGDWVRATSGQFGALEACWYISVRKYLNQVDEFSYQRDITYTDDEGNTRKRTGNEPQVTVKRIEAAAKAGLTPRLFIEELDKIPNVTRNRGGSLFDLCNEVDAQGGQIVVTSNKPADELFELFTEMNGEAMVRRFTASNATGKGKLLDLYNLPGLADLKM